MSIAELKPDELESILVATGVDPTQSAAQDPERIRMILGFLETAGLLGIDVTPNAITLSLPASFGPARSLVLPRRGLVH